MKILELSDQNLDLFSKIQRFVYRIYRTDNKNFIFEISKKYFDKLFIDFKLNYKENRSCYFIDI